VDQLFRELARALIEDPPDDPEEYQHLATALRDRVRRRPERPLLLPEPKDDRLVALGRLLDADPADARTLDELGAQVGSSARTLSRLCRTELGITFPVWRTRIRLSHSLVLLAEGRTVTSTAH